MSDELRDILEQAKAAPDLVYVEGGVVRNRPTLPLGSVESLANFAEASWKRCLQYDAARFKVDSKLAQAEHYVEKLVDRGLDKDTAIALMAIQEARTVLGA